VPAVKIIILIQQTSLFNQYVEVYFSGDDAEFDGSGSGAIVD